MSGYELQSSGKVSQKIIFHRRGSIIGSEKYILYSQHQQIQRGQVQGQLFNFPTSQRLCLLAFSSNFLQCLCFLKLFKSQPLLLFLKRQVNQLCRRTLWYGKNIYYSKLLILQSYYCYYHNGVSFFFVDLIFIY